MSPRPRETEAEPCQLRVRVFLPSSRDWQHGSLLWRQRAAPELHSVAFTEDGSHVLLAGKATLKVRQGGRARV
jgi:hypothetical protein